MLEIKIVFTAAPELLSALFAFRAPPPQPVQLPHAGPMVGDQITTEAEKDVEDRLKAEVAKPERSSSLPPPRRGRPPKVAAPSELPPPGPTLPGDSSDPEELKAACRIIIEGVMSKDMEIQTQNPGTEYRVGREKVKAVLTEITPSGKLKDVPVERLAEALEKLKAL